MIVSESEVQRIYRKRFADTKATRYRTWNVLVNQFFSRWMTPTDTVLDLGCGYGEFLNHLPPTTRRIGVDLNPDSPSHLADGIEFHQHSVCDLSFLPDDSVDFAFTSNLMEHLPGKREVEQMVREVRRVLRPGGTFVALGPNVRALPGAYWDFWDHVVPISDTSLRELLSNVEFEILNSYARFLPYTIHSKLPNHPILVSIYLRIPLAWQFLGKQFLIRARKPDNDD